jgi:hypothetical protein
MQGPQSRSVRFWTKEKSLSPAGIATNCSGRRLVTVLTELTRHSLSNHKERQMAGETGFFSSPRKKIFSAFFVGPGIMTIWASATTICIEKRSAQLEIRPKRDPRTKCNRYLACCWSALNITYCQTKYLPARTPSLFHLRPSLPYGHPNNAWSLPIFRSTRQWFSPKHKYTSTTPRRFICSKTLFFFLTLFFKNAIRNFISHWSYSYIAWNHCIYEHTDTQCIMTLQAGCQSLSPSFAKRLQ